jgi:hypothetical protein
VGGEGPVSSRVSNRFRQGRLGDSQRGMALDRDQDFGLRVARLRLQGRMLSRSELFSGLSATSERSALQNNFPAPMEQPLKTAYKLQGILSLSFSMPHRRRCFTAYSAQLER